MPRSVTPRWLNPDERRAWLALIGMITLLPSTLDSQMLRDSGMSSFEYHVLARLSEQADRALQLKQLAIFSNGSLSRLSHVITRLVERGWITRSQDPANGRITLATLTDEGYRQVVKAAPAHVEEVRRLVFDALTPEQVRSLADVASTIGAVLGAPSPDDLNVPRPAARSSQRSGRRAAAPPGE
jgi:DNA-binding MarR family transcriptional regulator